MKQQPPESPPATANAPATSATRSKTVINHVAPTVVRRRVVEVPVSAKVPIGYSASDDDDDNGPPSSVNVARALASLRGHELQRLEKILSDEDDAEAEEEQRISAAADEPIEQAPPSLRPPTVKCGPTISVAQLSQRIGVEDQELVTALVTHGFFSVTVKSTLPRETARAAATLFGFQIEETDEVEASPRSKPVRAKAATKSGATTQSGAATKSGAAVTRRTSRRA